MKNIELSKNKISDAIFMEKTFVGTLIATTIIITGPNIAFASQKFIVNGWRTYCIHSIMRERMPGVPDYLKPVILKEVKEYCG